MHYTNSHAQFVFIVLYGYIQMYFRIYNAVNVLLWIPCRKKYWRDDGQHGFSTRLLPGCPCCWKTLFLLDFDKHSSLFIQLLHTYIHVCQRSGTSFLLILELNHHFSPSAANWRRTILNLPSPKPCKLALLPCLWVGFYNFYFIL